MKKKMLRDDFGTILISSVSNIDEFNSHMKRLGITVKPYVGYEYYYGSNFICSTEDLCVDDILDELGFEVVDE